MNILAVSSHTELLSSLKDALRRLFPGAEIACAADPLMAGKYAFHNRVDILLAEADMKRMDGVQLVRFVRQERPAVRAYLLVRRDAPSLPVPEAAGVIALPFTVGGLAAALNVRMAESEEEKK